MLGASQASCTASSGLTLDRSVANVLKSWVREHMDHDEFDADLLRRIADFATTVMRDPVQSPQIIKVVEERVRPLTSSTTR